MIKEILVIDDNPDIRFLICNILEEQNRIILEQQEKIKFLEEQMNKNMNISKKKREKFFVVVTETQQEIDFRISPHFELIDPAQAFLSSLLWRRV